MKLDKDQIRELRIMRAGFKKMQDTLNDGSNEIHREPIEIWKLCPGKMSHFYALLIYYNMEKTKALKEVETKSYDELNEHTHVDYFIMSACEGTRKFLFKNFSMDDLKEVVRGDGDFVEYKSGYLLDVGKHIKAVFDDNEMALFEQYMNIADYMNNKRIQENVNDDFYQNPTDEHKILRELPLELAGYKEAHNFFTFMLPLINKFDLPKIGDILSIESIDNEGEYEGLFSDCENTEMFYSVRVLNFLENNNIRKKEDLRNYLKNIGNRYEPLNPDSAPKEKKKLAEDRLKKMTEDKFVDDLTDYILKTNKYIQEIFDEFETQSL